MSPLLFILSTLSWGSADFHPTRNPGGIRFGSAEIYEVLDSTFSTLTGEDIVSDYLAVGQKTDGGADESVILFVKLPPGYELSSSFESRIKAEIRAQRSARHVPARVCFLRGVPRHWSLTQTVIDITSEGYSLYPQW